ncbi:MAG: phosphatase domain-containing protein [Myxococcota bacterium]|nr:phosphatase domain-containing protein [Myxococcota bacterium]
MRVYRWDLDKTYLQTDFESLRGLLRSATEPAHRKKAVPGAAALMRGLGADPRNRITILSGSPTQMRDVLREKLDMDGVRFDQLVLKNSLRHFRRGEFRAIKGQFGYKLPALLQQRAGLGPATTETLFGDDAEVDALVYAVYADAVAGRLRPAEVSRIMEAAGSYPDHIGAALDALSRLSRAEAVHRIFIRLERPRAPVTFEALGQRVVPVHGWWQAALVLLSDGHITGRAAGAVLDELRTAGADGFEIASLTQDIVRRGFVGVDVVGRVLGDESALGAARAAVERLSELSVPPPLAPPVQAPDYISLVRGWDRNG